MTPELQEHPIALNNQPTWTPLAISPIATTAQYIACADHLKTIKAYQKRVAEFFKPHKQRLDEAKAALLTDERKALAQANEDEGICKRAMVVWDDEQERMRRLEETRVREEARVAEERRQLEEAAALELEAHRTEDHALMSEAVELMERPVAAPAIIVPKATPRVAGISFRETWKYRVVDPAKIPREYLKLDDVKIGAVVRALKSGTNIPGIQAYPDKGVGAGGGR